MSTSEQGGKAVADALTSSHDDVDEVNAVVVFFAHDGGSTIGLLTHDFDDNRSPDYEAFWRYAACGMVEAGANPVTVIEGIGEAAGIGSLSVDEG